MSNAGTKVSPYEEHSKRIRSAVDQETRRSLEHGDCTLETTLESCIDIVTYRYANTTVPLAEVEAELHDAWYVCIKAAKHMYCSDYKQDAVVRHLVGAKAMGHLRRPEAALARPGTGSDGELICFRDGSRFWADLPFFGADLVHEWTNRYYFDEHYDEDQRTFLASFVGRLLSVGIYQGPAECLLSLLRETLEEPRPLVFTVVTGNDGNDRAETTIVIDDLLGALQQLFHHTGEGVFMLRYHHSLDSDPMPSANAQFSSLGQLAIQAGIMSSGGYDPERWMFWTQRLKELKRCGVESIAGNAEACLLEMYREVDGKVGRPGCPASED